MAQVKKKKISRARPTPISEAMSRLDLMLTVIEKEVRNAIWVKSALEVGNSIVMENYRSSPFDGANCYNALRDAAQTTLILLLCKLFETPRPRKGYSVVAALNRSDLASIPVFLHLLKQKRCRAKLIERATAGWNDDPLARSDEFKRDCLVAIQRCDEVERRLKSKEGRHIVKTLSAFRDDHVAHLYVHVRPWNANRYKELFALLNIASDLVSSACMVFSGRNIDFCEIEEMFVEESLAFWMPALAAAAATGRFSMDHIETK